MRARAMHTLLRFVEKKKFFSDSFLDFVLCGVLCAMETVSDGGAGRSHYAVVHAGNRTLYGQMPAFACRSVTLLSCCCAD